MTTQKLTHLFLVLILAVSLASCGGSSGGGGGDCPDNDPADGGTEGITRVPCGEDQGDDNDGDEDADLDEEDLDDDIDPEGIDPNGSADPGVNAPPPGPAVTEVAFDFSGAIGLAIDNSPGSTTPRQSGGGTTSTNLKRVNADNSLSNALSSGTVSVQSFMVAAQNQVYLLLRTAVQGCLLIRVDGNTNRANCVDSTLTSINWANAFGDPIQFDGEGNIYYQGSAGGRTILRVNAAGVTTDLINDNISLTGFLVMNDKNVIYSGSTRSTGTTFTRVITPAPAHSLITLFMNNPSFMTFFPDNNVYYGNTWSSPNGIYRYLTATHELDPKAWIGNGTNNYFRCADAGMSSSSYCASPKLVKTTNKKVYAILSDGSSTGRRTLAQYYPEVFETDSIVTKITLSKGILSYILLGGFDSENRNKLTLYDTNTDSETDLLGSEDIEAYHIDYRNSGGRQLVMFDGLDFIGNKYVLCQVDLTDNNKLTCSPTNTMQLTDLQLFDNDDTIAGGGTDSTKTYTIGGSVSGLYGSLVLENGDDSVTLTNSGVFTFPIAVESDFDVTIGENPSGQTCTVAEGAGTVDQDHVDWVSIDCSVNSGVIVSYAGGGSLSGNSAEGVDATRVSLGSIYAMARDSSDNLYLSESNRVRKITADGIITTIAGNGNSGYSGDGGPATSAKIRSEGGLATDSSGNIFFADSTDHVVRKIDGNGIITTVAGTGMAGFSGDGGPATSAALSYPRGLAVDTSGNLYVADNNNSRVRKIDSNGMITTVAGGASCCTFQDGLAATAVYLGGNTPSGLAVDAVGNLYIVSSSRILKVDTNGIISTFAGNGTFGFGGDGGPATSANLRNPVSVTLDAAGNLYIADTENHRVRRVDTSGIITTIAGTGISNFSGDGGPATSATLSSPKGVVFDSSGNLYIADTNNERIRMVAP